MYILLNSLIISRTLSCFYNPYQSYPAKGKEKLNYKYTETLY